MTRFGRALIAATLSATASVWGEKEPVIQRLGDGDLIPVRTMVRFTTLIVMPDGEEVSEVTCGDKEYWVVEAKDQNVHVKPAKEGAKTNLNIVSKSRVVYSFLLEEVSGSKGRPAKVKPDLIVRVNPEDLSQLRKDKENLTEALSRAEHELKAEKERAAEAERKRLQKKEEPAHPTKKDAEGKKAEIPVAAPDTVVGQALIPATALPIPEPPESTMKVYVVKKYGIVESTGRVARDVLRRVGHFFRIF